MADSHGKSGIASGWVHVRGKESNDDTVERLEKRERKSSEDYDRLTEAKMWRNREDIRRNFCR